MYHAMIQSGVEPDDGVFLLVIDAQVKLEDIEGINLILQRVRDRSCILGVKPKNSAEIFHKILQASTLMFSIVDPIKVRLPHLSILCTHFEKL
jgi:hypothetical protein